MNQNGKLPVIISDGYTRTSVLNELEGIHGKLTFIWRPTPDDLRAEYLDHLKLSTTSKDEHLAMCKILNKHILEWSAGDKSVERIAKLHPVIWKRLVGVVVWGDEKPDQDDPLWKRTEQQVELEPGKSLDELLAKNSVTEPISSV